MKIRQILVVGLILIFFIQLGAISQNCARKKHKICNKEYIDDDYDYESQSRYAYLFSGDTQRVNIILYSKQDFKILICSEEQLGIVEYRIVEEERVKKRYVKEIKEVNPFGSGGSDSDDSGWEDDSWSDDSWEDESWDSDDDSWDDTDEWSDSEEEQENVLAQEEEEPETVLDTVWGVKTEILEKELYVSSESDKPYFEIIDNDKIRRVVVEIIIPQGSAEGCVSLLVGRKKTAKKQFRGF